MQNQFRCFGHFFIEVHLKCNQRRHLSQALLSSHSLFIIFALTEQSLCSSSPYLILKLGTMHLYKTTIQLDGCLAFRHSWWCLIFFQLAKCLLCSAIDDPQWLHPQLVMLTESPGSFGLFWIRLSFAKESNLFWLSVFFFFWRPITVTSTPFRQAIWQGAEKNEKLCGRKCQLCRKDNR